MHQKLKLPRKLKKEFIEKNADQLDWDEVSLLVKIEDLPFDFIEKFSEEWNWEIIATTHVISEKFLLRFKKHLNPHHVLNCQFFYINYFNEVIDELTEFEKVYFLITAQKNNYGIRYNRRTWQSRIKLAKQLEKEDLKEKRKEEIKQWLKRKWSQLKISFL